MKNYLNTLGLKSRIAFFAKIFESAIIVKVGDMLGSFVNVAEPQPLLVPTAGDAPDQFGNTIGIVAPTAISALNVNA